MKRTADSTIKGFLYQFNKTIISVVGATAGEIITVEGLVEDIDIEALDGTLKAVQCKYHEAASTFSESLIFKPLLQMAETFSKSTAKTISYRIFVHVPGEAQGERKITAQTLENALATGDQELKKIVARIISPFDKNTFLDNVILDFGPSIDELEQEAMNALRTLGLNDADVDCVLYPNAIHRVAKLSSLKQESDRKITRRIFYDYLSAANATAVSKWVLASRNKKKILEAVRKQLSEGLSQNSRERFFYFQPDAIDNFDDEIVIFVCNYLKKYHTKPSHDKTPLIAIEKDISGINDIQSRLFRKEVKVTTGMVGSNFEITELFREPITKQARGKIREREFDLRLLHTRPTIAPLNYRRSQDLFCVCDSIPTDLDVSDVNVIHLGISSFKELEYVMQLRGTHE
ncbi:hypothetical protein [Undibacterium squillarum]|uniref:DUF4297 domain-containing protein n=1 Tax=Undibacterium squillarum TaxID=1131567 RepID=A0ABQ2XR04_9BURK|nr:hypothetical protein [Undibacterium squillarum]GGX29877.1 hypothetical protein GCM10010946_03560 [Undibacterium squillarum]